MNALRIAIAGAAGRMGRTLVRLISEADGLTLSGASEHAGSSALGADAGVLAGLDPAGVSVLGDVRAATANSDIWIDFTTPAATVAALAALSAPPVRAAIIGTTGLDAAAEKAIADAAKRLVIVKSGNFSLGVNMLAALARQAAARLGADWDVEIVEAHHHRKVDAPSGTALMLGEAAAQGRGETLASVRLKPHDGITGPRKQGGIGFASIRGGGIFGEHDVIFAAEEEVLRLSHVALDRALFARGALVAARWAAAQTPGLYSMADVLGLS